jgi:hypothetical protein
MIGLGILLTVLGSSSLPSFLMGRMGHAVGGRRHYY